MKRILLILTAILLLLPVAETYAASISKGEFNRLLGVAKILAEQIKEMEADLKTSKSFNDYKKSYMSAIPKTDPKPMATAEVAKLLAEAKYVLLGDEHTTARSQMNTAMVLDLMKKGKGQVTLVIEWLDISFQNEVNSFLSGKMPLKELRTKTGYDKLWGFPWAPYSKILGLAKRIKAPVLLAERLKGKQKSLAERDSFITQTIKAHQKLHPEMRYLVVYGDYHIIGAGHLSDKLAAAGFKPQLCLLGEAPDKYWRLLAKTMDPAKVFFGDLGNGKFYIANGTPLQRAVSYRNYLMKMLGYGKDDFEEWITNAEILPSAAAGTDFNRLHQP